MNFNSAVVFFEPLAKCITISFASSATEMTSIEVPFNAGKETVLSKKRCSSFPDLVRVIGQRFIWIYRLYHSVVFIFVAGGVVSCLELKIVLGGWVKRVAKVQPPMNLVANGVPYFIPYDA